MSPFCFARSSLRRAGTYSWAPRSRSSWKRQRTSSGPASTTPPGSSTSPSTSPAVRLLRPLLYGCSHLLDYLPCARVGLDLCPKSNLATFVRFEDEEFDDVKGRYKQYCHDIDAGQRRSLRFRIVPVDFLHNHVYTPKTSICAGAPCLLHISDLFRGEASLSSRAPFEIWLLRFREPAFAKVAETVRLRQSLVLVKARAIDMRRRNHGSA